MDQGLSSLPALIRGPVFAAPRPTDRTIELSADGGPHGPFFFQAPPGLYWPPQDFPAIFGPGPILGLGNRIYPPRTHLGNNAGRNGWLLSQLLVNREAPAHWAIRRVLSPISLGYHPGQDTRFLRGLL